MAPQSPLAARQRAAGIPSAALQALWRRQHPWEPAVREEAWTALGEEWTALGEEWTALGEERRAGVVEKDVMAMAMPADTHRLPPHRPSLSVCPYPRELEG